MRHPVAMSEPTTYLDHAASTPVRPEARAALEAWLTTTGNGSSSHAAGQQARRAVEEARERAAGVLGVAPQDVVFTSGGTEADNLAIKGIAWAAREDGRAHLVTTAVEHPAVRDTCRWLAEHQGFALTEVPPRRDGTVDPERVLAAVREDTALVSVMAANNELGAVNDLAALVDAAARAGRGAAQRHGAGGRDAGPGPARRATRWPCPATSSVPRRGSAWRCCGGACPIVPLQPRRGAGPRGALRHLRVGAGRQPRRRDRSAAAADRDRLVATAPRRRPIGWPPACWRWTAWRATARRIRARRLPTHLHVGIAGVAGEALTFALDRAGVQAATGAACGSGAVEGQPRRWTPAASRPTRCCGCRSGWTTTDADVDRALDVLVDAIARLRRGGRGRAGGLTWPRVLVAMSGGVDSAVAAARLVEAGHDVTGVHLKLADVPLADQVPGQGCCTLDDAQDARRAAQVLGIPFYVWDMGEVFVREVQDPFAAAYADGVTPNPCVTCNERVKYAALLDRATHARVRRAGDRPPRPVCGTRTGRRSTTPTVGARLHRAVDPAKDQSYVLYVATPGAARTVAVPRRRAHEGSGPGARRRARPACGRQARFLRRLLHPRRRHGRLPRRPPAGRPGPHRRPRRA